MTIRKFALLICTLLSLAETSYAAEICAEHDGIPVYCEDTVRTFFEIDSWHMNQYADDVSNPLSVPSFGDCYVGLNCKTSRIWFDGPHIPAPSTADVSVKVSFDAYAVCGGNRTYCLESQPRTGVVRFDLMADGTILESYVVDGSNSVFSTFENAWKFSTPVNSKILAATVNVGQKISLRVTPLAPEVLVAAGLSYVKLYQVRVNFTAIP